MEALLSWALECGQALSLFDCINSGILVAWGTSKSFLDCRSSGLLAGSLWSLTATFAYSFGGGITRDLLSRLAGEEIAVGNFSPAVVAPAIVGTLLFRCLLVLGASPLLQLGAGLPALVGLFHAAGYLVG